MDDDFEVEVSDLRTGQVLKTARDLPTSEGPPSVLPVVRDTLPADQDFELEASEVSEVSVVSEVPAGTALGGFPTPLLPPAGQRPNRRQLIGAGASAALVVVVLIALLGGLVGKGGFTFGLFPTPVPTPTLADGADTFYMVNAVPWGRLRADGKDPGVTYSSGSPTLFTLAVGRHSIQYDAPPFPPVRCTVSVPAATTDTCRLYSLPQGETIQSIQPNNRGIDFGDTVAHLSRGDLQALVNTVSAGIAAPIGTTTVPAGGRYQGANGQVLVAAKPLQAQAYYVLNSQATTDMFGGNCSTLCDIQFGNGSPAGDVGWNLVAPITPIWRYTDSSGTAVQLPATPQLPGVPVVHGGPGPGPEDMFLFLSVIWNGAWQVASHVDFGQAGCFNAQNVLSISSSLNNWANGGYNSSEMPAPNPADGCLLVFQANGGQGNGIGKPLWYLYRFGLILAANSNAHRVSPELPVATGGEATLARQLAQLLAQQQNG